MHLADEYIMYRKRVSAFFLIPRMLRKNSADYK